MKTSYKIITTLILLAAFVNCANSQGKKGTFKVSGAKKVIFENLHNDLIIKGHSGSDIEIDASDYEAPPENAKGLKPIYSSGVDNTGTGLSIKEDGNVVRISLASKRAEDADYTFSIPQNMDIKVEFQHPWGDDVEIENMSGEVEVSSLNGDIELTKITGPVVIYSINGDIEADFDKLSQDGPTSIETINGEIDITMPANSTADVSIKTLHGEAFTNFDLDIKSENDDMTRIGGNKVEGQANGGGVELSFKTINGGIYLRKK